MEESKHKKKNKAKKDEREINDEKQRILLNAARSIREQ